MNESHQCCFKHWPHLQTDSTQLNLAQSSPSKMLKAPSNDQFDFTFLCPDHLESLLSSGITILNDLLSFQKYACFRLWFSHFALPFASFQSRGYRIPHLGLKARFKVPGVFSREHLYHLSWNFRRRFGRCWPFIEIALAVDPSVTGYIAGTKLEPAAGFGTASTATAASNSR